MASGWVAGLFVPCAEGWPRARRRLVTCSRVDPLPSSEAEIGHLPEGRSATLERGGDWSPSRGKIRYPRARRRLPSWPERDPRARQRLVTRSREDPLPSSEVEIAQRAREGPS